MLVTGSSDREWRVADAPAPTAPRFCVVSVTVNVVPRFLVAGSADVAVATRSACVTVRKADAVAAELLLSLPSVTALMSSAHAST